MRHAKRPGTGRSSFKLVRARSGKTYKYPKARYDKKAKAAAAARKAARAPLFPKLVTEFKRNPERFRKEVDLGKPVCNGYRDAEDRDLDFLEARFGWMTRADLEDDRARTEFTELRRELWPTRTMARKRMNLLYRLLQFGRAAGYLAINQMDLVPPVPRAYRPRAEKRWDKDSADVILTRCKPHITRPFRCALWTAAREGDMIGFDRSMIDGDGWLSFMPHKTKDKSARIVFIPVFAFPPLQALLDELPPEGHLFRMGRFPDRPWPNAQSFSLAFMEARYDAFGGKASAPDLHFNDTRGTLTTQLVEAGCTDFEVESITGHVHGRDPITGERKRQNALGEYVAYTKQMALNAYTKLWNHMQGVSNVVPFPAKRSA